MKTVCHDRSISYHQRRLRPAHSAQEAARSREELPHVRGQGQKPGGPHARRAAAERNYPTSEVGGSGRRVPDCDGAGTAERSYPTSEVRGAAERRYPASNVRGGDERSYPTSKVRGGGREEIPQALKPETRGSRWEDQPHAVAARAQEGLEELSHVEGQEGWR